jgi:hypothetical protein
MHPDLLVMDFSPLPFFLTAAAGSLSHNHAKRRWVDGGWSQAAMYVRPFLCTPHAAHHGPLLMCMSMFMRMLMRLLMWLLMRLSMRLLLHACDTCLGGVAGTSLAHAHTALGAHTAAAALH